MVPRPFFDRRILFPVVACVFVSILSFGFFSSGVRPSYDWLPKPLHPTTGFVTPAKDPNDPDVVNLDYLSFRPKKSEHVKSYWNIPFATSAGGKNRFRGPQPPPKFKGIMEFGGKLGMCPNIQKIDSTLRNKEDVAGEDVSGLEVDRTEDCLSLNVFTPIDAEPGDELPVLVNIPGGGFHLPGRASGTDFVEKSRPERAEGAKGKVDKGVIVITMSYRNGIYGFLSGDQIEKDGDFNPGLLDQRATLEWIQKYIRYFGGNPDHVVIMGTSAGGASVLLQMTANGGDNTFPVPGSGIKKLFHGAITQSPASPTFYTPEQANHFWEIVAKGVNCTDLSIDCVRKSAVGDLYWENFPMSFPGRNTPPRWMWAPTASPNSLWTEPGTTAILSGRYAKVPAILGYTSNEGTDQVKKEIDDEGAMKSYLADHYPLLSDADLDLLVKNYPNDKHWPDSGRFWDAVSKAQGELRYICPTYLSSNAMSKHNPSSVKTYQYHWDVVYGVDNENGYGTKHAATVGRVLARPPNEISDYFISFIKHLDPNVERGKDTPKWEALDQKAPKRMLFSNRKDREGPIIMSMAAQDEERERRCQDIRRMMPRTQQ
ncbi:alpha/beta-hydrolase [Amniculicola lignicola CBS 123094]|uniref:Carboxylic ester hydrolase n=1 Tax=Amniculicola lignicola CBS 123094 TaxID=1392246 RepID=A0A6A5X3Z7_9PLEO|nr:alpha/beta-hydrolase [Amniculicola lignicola CBS 123094]